MTQAATAMTYDRPPPMPRVPQRRRRWVSVLLVVVVFLGGFVSGGGAVLRFIQVRVREVIEHPERESARRAADLKKQLRLTPDQTRQIEAIYSNRITAVVHNGRGQLELLDEEIVRVLDDRQRQRWQKMHAPHGESGLPPKLPPADNGGQTTPSVGTTTETSSPAH